MNIQRFFLSIFFIACSFMHAADVPESRYYSESDLKAISRIALNDRDFLENKSLEQLKKIFYSLNILRYKAAPTIGEIAVLALLKRPQEAFNIKIFQNLYERVVALLPEKLVEELTSISFDKPLSKRQADTYSIDIELLRYLAKSPDVFQDLLEKMRNFQQYDILKSLHLCPIFVGLAENPKYHQLIDLTKVSQDQINSMNENDAIAYQIEKASGVTLWLKTTFTRNPAQLACMVNYTPPQKKNDGIIRQLIQMRTINQSIGEFKKIGTQHCSGLSVHNALCVNTYAATHSEKYLQELYDEKAAIDFLKKYKCQERIDKKEIEDKYLSKFSQSERKHIAVIDSPLVFDRKHQDALTSSDIGGINAIKGFIHEGLKKNTFYFSFIVGTLDERALSQELPEHWYCFSIIKSGSLIQYIVIDTAADYHLQPGSYELMRLHYFIDLIEQNSSEITIPEQVKKQ